MTPRDKTTADDGSGKRHSSHPSIDQYTIEPNKSLSYNVISAVATTTGIPPEQMEPLYNAIDPDALDQLFGMPSETFRCSQEIAISFQYEGYLVTVQNGRQITVSPRVDTNP
ncbi:HalOD1 output domain-containing protein [Haloprofundus salilacus]|uniref:HalOD1 output domain-containing protein n=1 Tax=Haloprofundus salilacus TaxID=2876190 RepID=UPI001CCA5B3E